MHWYVITPEYTNYYNDWDEPPEIGADVVTVEANTKREALVKGVRELRRTRSGWLDDANSNPFTGLRAEKAECEHGYCSCDLRECVERNPRWTDICPICEEEWKQNCEHEMRRGLAQISGQTEATEQLFCDICFQTINEIANRSNQKFKYNEDYPRETLADGRAV